MQTQNLRPMRRNGDRERAGMPTKYPIRVFSKYERKPH